MEFEEAETGEPVDEELLPVLSGPIVEFEGVYGSDGSTEVGELDRPVPANVELKIGV
jgi:hypothetical protein